MSLNCIIILYNNIESQLLMEKKQSKERLTTQRSQKRFQRSSSKVFKSGFGLVSPNHSDPPYNPYPIQAHPTDPPLHNNPSIAYQPQHQTTNLATSQHSLINTCQKFGLPCHTQGETTKIEPEQSHKLTQQPKGIQKSECRIYKFVPAKDSMYGVSKISIDKSFQSSNKGTIKKKSQTNNQPSLLQRSIHISQNSEAVSRTQKPVKNENISFLANRHSKTTKNTCAQNKQNIPGSTKSELKNYKKMSDFLGKNSKQEKTQKKIDYWNYGKLTKKNVSIFDKTEESKTVKTITQNEDSFTYNQQAYENKIAQLERQNSELKQKNKALLLELSKLEASNQRIQTKVKDLPILKIKEFSNKVCRLKENEQQALLNEIKMIQSYKQMAQQNIIADLKQQIDEVTSYIDCGDRSTNMDSIINDLFKQNSQLKQQISGLNLKLWAVDKKNSSKLANQEKIRKLQLQNRYNKATLKQSSALIQKLRQQNDKLRKQSRKCSNLDPKFSSNKFLDNSSLSLSFSLC